jgi:prepilin-type N-terminal cleavage/methylation domain-containing protein
MKCRASNARGGFTLAEVAVTLVIVGVALVYILQGVNTSYILAAQTHNRKVARELAFLTLAQVDSGLFWEDIDDRMFGNYAEEGYEDWHWEVVCGDETFSDELFEAEGGLQYDYYRERERREEEDDDDDELDETHEPFETVRIRVTFPKLGEFQNAITLERNIPWEQVYGPEVESGAKTPASPGEEPIE